DYDEIAGALANSVSAIAGSAKFYESLSKRLDVVEGADVNDGSLVVTNPEKEQVFAALCSAVQEKAKMVPASKILAEAEDRLRDAEGGEEFLRYAEDEM
ncbi:MAG: hypothetical protein SV760_09685, partial [Halobacteria archaeon]|nr:hypothetical protein [Halobacteria archaeon]